MPYNNVLVVEVRASHFPLVLTTCRKHSSCWSIVRASYYFADEAELSRRNHILYAWDVVKHLTHFLVPYVLLFDVAHREIEYPPNIPMEKNFELTKKRLPQRPIFASP